MLSFFPFYNLQVKTNYTSWTFETSEEAVLLPLLLVGICHCSTLRPKQLQVLGFHRSVVGSTREGQEVEVVGSQECVRPSGSAVISNKQQMCEIQGESRGP